MTESSQESVLNIIVASQNKQKINVANYIRDHFIKNGQVISVNCSSLELPEQPFGTESTFRCAKTRHNYIKKVDNGNISYNCYLAIEDGVRLIDMSTRQFIEYKFSRDLSTDINDFVKCFNTLDLDKNRYAVENFSAILLEYNGIFVSVESKSINFDLKYLKMLQNLSLKAITNKITGFDETAGSLMQKEDSQIDKQNWMLHVSGVDRTDIMKLGVECALKKYDETAQKLLCIKNNYLIYENFPKPNVAFQDLFSILKNNKLLKLLIDLLHDRYKYDDIDFIVGLEARGFTIGTTLAYLLGCGFIPIRKQGKLPGNCVKFTFKKEYGVDTFEMQTDITMHSKILIIDDLIALGGSITASHILIDLVECDIVDTCVIREVSGILAHPKLKNKVTVLIKE